VSIPRHGCHEHVAVLRHVDEKPPQLAIVTNTLPNFGVQCHRPGFRSGCELRMFRRSALVADVVV
jgi:hypothetical protein